MAIISVKDQNGNPVTDVDGRVNVRVSKTSDDAAVDDRFTDNVGNTAWPGGYVGGEVWTSANLYVNTRNVNSKFKSATIVNADLSKDVSITIERIGSTDTCPDPNNKQAVKDWFNKIAASVGAHTNTAQNRQLMTPGFNKCAAKWQVDGSGNTRARFFLDPADTFQYTVDTGNENELFNLTFRY